ncbi:MAG: protein kinase [Tatlockia sp.]|nr:protein kinase [Tatlockia sp.]
MTIINFKNINHKQAQDLYEFLEAESKLGRTFWKKNTGFRLNNGTLIYLKNDIVQRERKSGKGVRYEVISNSSKLGSGYFGYVAKIKGTLIRNQETVYLKKESKEGRQRAVKIQDHSEEHNPLENVKNEFEFTRRSESFSVKAPTIIQTSNTSSRSYTVMDKFSGKELFEVLEDDFHNKILTTRQRIELSKALLFALKNHVSSKGMIHRDIKPENIFVNLKSPISVTIFDYGFAIDSKKPDDKKKYTAAYMAPEILKKHIKLTEKVDVFSIARVIALVWNVDFDTYDPEISVFKTSKYLSIQRLYGLFNGITDLDANDKETIRLTLLAMLQNEPELRIGVNEAIASFSKVPHGNSFFKIKNKPYEFTRVEDSWLDDEQQLAIQKAIWQLENEIASCWPYFYKERKKEKIKGLNILLEYSQNSRYDINQAIDEVEKLCPEFRTGIISDRIAKLMEELGAAPLSLDKCLLL